MKIVIDTELKKTIVPKAFFDDMRRINDVATLTGRKQDLEWKEYLGNIISECTKDIINEKNVPKRTRAKRVTANVSIDAKNVNVKQGRK